MQRHDFDLISFLFGLLFAGLGAVWLITEEAIDADLTEWFWPLILVVGGVVVLGSALTRARKYDSAPVATAETTEDEAPSEGLVDLD